MSGQTMQILSEGTFYETGVPAYDATNTILARIAKYVQFSIRLSKVLVLRYMSLFSVQEEVLNVLVTNYIVNPSGCTV
jgi:hypothetical protein